MTKELLVRSKNQGRRAAALLLFAPFGASPAAEPASTDDPCNFHSSIPLLERGIYKNYTYTERENDAAMEAAQLTADVRIEIASSGCVDSSARTYTLIYAGAAMPDRTLAQWAGVARHELEGLHYIDGGNDEVRETIGYAGRVAATHSAGDKVVGCADDSVPPDGECAWNTGGGRGIEIRRGPDTVQVILTEHISR